MDFQGHVSEKRKFKTIWVEEKAFRTEYKVT